MLERDSELKVAGARPSAYARVKTGASKDGTIVAWQSESWGTGGPGGGGMPPIPYVFSGIPNQRKEHIAIRNNIGPARAWRAPNHPQAAIITMCALDDLAAKLNMDPLQFFLKSIDNAAKNVIPRICKRCLSKRFIYVTILVFLLVFNLDLKGYFQVRPYIIATVS